MLGNFKKVFGEPTNWDNIPEVKIDENNLNVFKNLKANADGMKTTDEHAEYVTYRNSEGQLVRDKVQTISFVDNAETKPLTYDNIFDEVMKRLAVKPTFKHQCNNCGGVLEMDADQHIFRCPYCNTVYAVGISNIMAR